MKMPGNISSMFDKFGHWCCYFAEMERTSKQKTEPRSLHHKNTLLYFALQDVFQQGNQGSLKLHIFYSLNNGKTEFRALIRLFVPPWECCMLFFFSPPWKYLGENWKSPGVFALAKNVAHIDQSDKTIKDRYL